jgi:hypothetical protein
MHAPSFRDRETSRLHAHARRAAVTCAVAALSVIARPGQAQSVLAGSVRDAGSGAALPDAEVAIPQLQLRARTDASGRYRISDIPAGRHTVIVRRLGHDSLSMAVPFTGDDDVVRDFALGTQGQPLPEVPVSAAAEPIGNAKLREFERRRASAHGHFVTPAELEKNQQRRLSDIVQKLPGAIIVQRPQRGGMAAYVASSRGVVSIENFASGPFGTGCPVAIWLDGVPMSQPFDINTIQTRTVAAMEFYAGPARMPPELNATSKTCGALVIWTR